jgi:hypothetical protein
VEGCGMLWCLDLTYSTRSWCVWGEKLVTSWCVQYLVRTTKSCAKK